MSDLGKSHDDRFSHLDQTSISVSVAVKINRIYDCVEAETRKSQASCRISSILDSISLVF